MYIQQVAVVCRHTEYSISAHQGRVANPRPVAKIKTGLVSLPITDADDETGLALQRAPDVSVPH